MRKAETSRKIGGMIAAIAPSWVAPRRGRHWRAGPCGRWRPSRHSGASSVVEPLDHRGSVGAGRSRRLTELKAPSRSKQRRQRLLGHPDDAEAAVVGHHVARPEGVDVFRRQGDADDGELVLGAVDDRA